MIRDYINIGATPVAEDCLQVGTPAYTEIAAVNECKRFIKQLKAQFGPEPPNTKLIAKVFNHDFGTYYEVVCWYEDAEGEAYALKCEGEAWEEWRDANNNKEGGQK